MQLARCCSFQHSVSRLPCVLDLATILGVDSRAFLSGMARMSRRYFKPDPHAQNRKQFVEAFRANNVRESTPALGVPPKIFAEYPSGKFPR
jgi:hypothetical protein